MSRHGLSSDQLALLEAVFVPYADRISRVDLFGSQATGTWRPDSDVDLVVRGDLSERDIRAIWTSFDDSPLLLRVDVQAFEHIAYPPLRRHIEAVSVPLFTRAELMAQRDARAA